jgi:A/G-specific adenine glycosylase
MTPDSLKRLRDWFRANAAELPWRPADLDAQRNPYVVWISETMLQQTQVSTVKDYFIRWMKQFPDVETLAKADEAEVFKFWQGLGYYSRARNILKTAKIVATLRQAQGPSKMPETRKELEALPGIGAYTAGAILSLAYHKREAILDGNLVRIFSRLYKLDFLPTSRNRVRDDRSGMTEKTCAEVYWNYARDIADSPKAYMHNEALMELGRTVCKTKSPLCEACPLHNECRAFIDGQTAEFPPVKKRLEKNWHGTVLVVESKDGMILAVNGGQKFLDRQLSLPHFESVRGATVGFPAKAEDYINADDVETIEQSGTFRHSITVHKIECNVLHVQLSVNAKNARTSGAYTTKWIEKAKVFETFANSFSLKALKKFL